MFWHPRCWHRDAARPPRARRLCARPSCRPAQAPVRTAVHSPGVSARRAGAVWRRRASAASAPCTLSPVTPRTLTTGARQLVVHEAAVTMWSTSGLYSACGRTRHATCVRPHKALKCLGRPRKTRALHAAAAAICRARLRPMLRPRGCRTPLQRCAACMRGSSPRRRRAARVPNARRSVPESRPSCRCPACVPDMRAPPRLRFFPQQALAPLRCLAAPKPRDAAPAVSSKVARSRG